MEQLIKELVAEARERGEDPQQFVRELYNHELNFNNADPTSGMRCYEEHEISEMVLQEEYAQKAQNE